MLAAENVHALRIPFQIHTPAGVMERFVYSFIICTDRITLIDSGVAGSYPIIFDYLNQLGYQPQDIANLILTHSHPDHIGSALTVKQVSGCKIYAHASEVDWIEDTELQFRERPVPGFHTLVEGSVPVDTSLNDGEVLELGNGLDLQVIHSPGHSRGSMSLLLKGTGVLFCGDAVPMPGDMPIYEDVTASVNSIHRLQEIPELNLLLSSWDEPRCGEEAARILAQGLNYIQHIHEAVNRHRSYFTTDQAPEWSRQVMAELGLPPQAVNPLSMRTLLAHLQAGEL